MWGQTQAVVAQCGPGGDPTCTRRRGHHGAVAQGLCQPKVPGQPGRLGTTHALGPVGAEVGQSGGETMQARGRHGGQRHRGGQGPQRPIGLQQRRLLQRQDLGGRATIGVQHGQILQQRAPGIRGGKPAQALFGQADGEHDGRGPAQPTIHRRRVHPALKAVRHATRPAPQFDAHIARRVRGQRVDLGGQVHAGKGPRVAQQPAHGPRMPPRTRAGDVHIHIEGLDLVAAKVLQLKVRATQRLAGCRTQAPAQDGALQPLCRYRQFHESDGPAGGVGTPGPGAVAGTQLRRQEAALGMPLQGHQARLQAVLEHQPPHRIGFGRQGRGRPDLDVQRGPRHPAHAAIHHHLISACRLPQGVHLHRQLQREGLQQAVGRGGKRVVQRVGHQNCSCSRRAGPCPPAEARHPAHSAPRPGATSRAEHAGGFGPCCQVPKGT